MSTILLVEDEHLFADMICKALVAFGHDVVRARNGKEALRLYNAQTVSLVLADLIMPDMEGVELIVALRKAHPAVKVIAMSGGGRIQPTIYLAIAQQVGAVKTLAKPFPLEKLRAAVQECLAAP